MSGVLVTRATTPIGERLVRSLIADEHIGHVLAVGPHPAHRALPFSHPSRLTYLQSDLSRPRAIRKLLYGPARDLGIETVIHAPLHDAAKDSGRRVRAENVESTRELLRLSEEHPTIQRFVYRSYAAVYRVRGDQPTLLEEDHSLNLSPDTPQWIRDRVEADLTVCARMGMSSIKTVVLRVAECLAPGTGSQLYDFLQFPVCLTPMGFDPMLNLISMQDVVRALELAIRSGEQGVFNIPGKDTLPLSTAILKWGRISVPAPSLGLSTLYRARSRLLGSQFRYDMNHWRFHYSALLDGHRAKSILKYTPEHGIEWPVGRRASSQ